MEFQLFIFTVLMFFLTILLMVTGTKRKSMLDKRKEQSQNRLRENVLKKRIEKIAEERVRYSKRYEIETLCLQAGFRLSYGEYVMISITSAIVTAVLIGIALNNPILAIIFLVIGYTIPKQVIAFIKNRRLELMEKQIGSFMQMVLKRYENTKDFGKALELTMTEFRGEEPLYREIRQTVFDMNLGKTVEESMDGLARRTGNKYMERLSDYYKIASTIGTEDVRKNLLNQAFVQFEENRQAKNTMKKELAGVKREAYIMLASIPMFALYQVFTNPKYIDFMTNTDLGRIGTIVIVLVFLGGLWFINNKISAPLD